MAGTEPVVYLVNQYPAGSHTFIRREIMALERQQVRVARVSIRRWNQPLVDPDDIAEERLTTVLLEDGALNILNSVWKALLTFPAGFARALRQTFRMYRRGNPSLLHHIAYFVEACWLSLHMRDIGARHLHAHFGTNPAEVAMLAHLIGGVPYSFTVHGYDEFDRPQALGLDMKIEHAKAVVAISSYGRSQLMRWARVEDWSKIAVVHCGLESTFYDALPPHPPQPNRIVSIGRLCKEKAQLVLLDAAARLRQDGVNFELVFVGDGELRPVLERRIDELGVRSNVRITGWVASDAVRSELLSAVALAHPSFADGLPVVIMEAMALRRPVIACYVAGTPELVDTATGWLVPASSLDDLTAALKACLAMSETDRMQMGERARERVLERHQIDKEARKLAQLFAS